MEKKGVYFARKFILAVGVVLFVTSFLPAVNAEAKEVSLVKGMQSGIWDIRPIIIYVDGNLAFCLEPDMKSPGMVHIAHQNWIRKSHLSKAMYYMYVDRGMSNIFKRFTDRRLG